MLFIEAWQLIVAHPGRFAGALTADPPVMLMDEPFASLDPITRGRLQDEFLRILRCVRKTIVFVTHDIDEALTLGDRIAILREGALVQYDAREAILARPADAFVESLVGTDRALKWMGLTLVEAALEVAGAVALDPGAGELARCARTDARRRCRLASGDRGEWRRAGWCHTMSGIRGHTRACDAADDQ